jgi:AAA family ATP:ADP antiporter
MFGTSCCALHAVGRLSGFSAICQPAAACSFCVSAFLTLPVTCALAAFCENLLEQAGPRFAGPIAILRNWTFCLFYVMAELWGSVVVSVLFWGFANQITTVEEASQFYPLFGLGANVALIFSGQAVKYFSQVSTS